jgi:hypothetical protein
MFTIRKPQGERCLDNERGARRIARARMAQLIVGTDRTRVRLVRDSRWLALVSIGAWWWAGLLWCLPARAQEVRGNVSILGQVREGDQTRTTEAPQDLYGELSASHRAGSIDTYFRLERDFGISDGASDFYAGSLHTARIPGLDMTLGRQFLNEGPGGVFVADAGKVRIDPGGPVGITLFGGQPRYFEPTFSSNILSQDEVIFGGNLHAVRWRNTQLSLGYFQQDRDSRALRNLVTGTATRTLPELPGAPNFYGSVAYDAARQNLDLGTAGVDVFLPAPHLRFNFEGGYYNPQDHSNPRPVSDPNLRVDPIFDLFSVNEMVQWHGGLSYAVRPTVSAVANYSFQHYDQQERTPQHGRQVENSHLGSTGFVWLPGGDGLEVVRVEYYVVHGDGGDVSGGKVSYESRVYERLIFRSKVDVTGYEKESHQSSVAVSSFLGLGYVILPGLTWEVNFEGNHNNRFDEDFRFGFLISYRFRRPLQQPAAERSAS